MTPRRLAAAELRQPAQQVAREVARVHLRRAGRRARALLARRHDGELLDPALSEAIHDFRVALRRLRTWLRACRDVVSDTVQRGRLRALRDVSRRAGRVRDLEVELMWLRREAETGRPASPAARWLADRERDRHGRALLQLFDLVAGEWRRLAEALDDELGHYFVEVRVGDAARSPAMGVVLAGALRRHRDAFVAALTPPPRMQQVPELHRARIAAKHLRYLIEAFDSGPRSRSVALAALRRLQDDVGELHDAQMLAARLARLDRSKRRPGAPPPAAFAALDRSLGRRIREAWTGARSAMTEARRSAVLAEIEAMACRCEQAASSPERTR